MDKKRLSSLLMIVWLAAFPMLAKAEQVEEKPTALAMTGDLLVARPIGIGIFAVGTVVFVATLPFSLIGGNMGDAANTLVLQPGKEAFVRCLGCARPGRKEKLED